MSPPHGAGARGTGTRGVGLAIVLLLVAAFGLLLRHPAIHDVTTTPDDPPGFPASPPGDVRYPPEFVALQARAYPDVAPVAFTDSAPEVYARALETAAAMPGWQVVFRDDSLGVLQAVARTSILPFDDDVVVQVRPTEDGSESTLHVRSRSRIGRGDLGANARRIRAYLEALR